MLWCLKMAQAQLQDEHGNPIQLTDPYGNPVWLTDQHGNPVHLTGVVGVAASTDSTSSGATTAEKGVHGGRTVADLILASEERSESEKTVVNENDQTGHHERVAGQLHRSSSSSSSSSEDDGEGGRRKKGVKDKIKEKVPRLGGGKEHSHTVTSTTTAATGGNHHTKHEKKSIIEKIKEKLPIQHSH